MRSLSLYKYIISGYELHPGKLTSQIGMASFLKTYLGIELYDGCLYLVVGSGENQSLGAPKNDKETSKDIAFTVSEFQRMGPF